MAASKTKQPDAGDIQPEALPQTGGSWVRMPDGSLVAEVDFNASQIALKPSSKTLSQTSAKEG